MNLLRLQSNVFGNGMSNRSNIASQHVRLNSTAMQLRNHVGSIWTHLIKGIVNGGQTTIHREIDRGCNPKLSISFKRRNRDIFILEQL